MENFRLIAALVIEAICLIAVVVMATLGVDPGSWVSGIIGAAIGGAALYLFPSPVGKAGA